jgi:hypothetical protein
LFQGYLVIPLLSFENIEEKITAIVETWKDNPGFDV